MAASWTSTLLYGAYEWRRVRAHFDSTLIFPMADVQIGAVIRTSGQSAERLRSHHLCRMNVRSGLFSNSPDHCRPLALRFRRCLTEIESLRQRLADRASDFPLICVEAHFSDATDAPARRRLSRAPSYPVIESGVTPRSFFALARVYGYR